jgi:hypothetical protein
MLLWPAYVSKLVVIPIRTYLWETWFRTALGVIPFGLACALAERFWPAPNLAVFFLQIAALLPLLPLTLALIFRKELVARIRGLQRSRTSDHRIDEYEPSTTIVG